MKCEGFEEVFLCASWIETKSVIACLKCVCLCVSLSLEINREKQHNNDKDKDNDNRDDILLRFTQEGKKDNARLVSSPGRGELKATRSTNRSCKGEKEKKD